MKRFPLEGAHDDAENVRYTEFEEKINAFVGKHLSGYKANHTQNKVICDPVWGAALFYPWELNILDAPLLQRLKKIRQVGLAMLKYPSARHTRFEHTLGVMSVVTKMVNSLNQKTNQSTDEIDTEDFYKLRLAALLHDMGHCFFSHLSEEIYGKLEPFADLMKDFEIFRSAQEHEIFAYMIITSEAFKEFFKSHVGYPFSYTDSLFDDIGRMITGAFIEPEAGKGVPIRKYYMTQIINGQYDADRLDYLRRDSYTAGISITCDIEEFLYTIVIAEREEKISEETVIGKHLVIPVAGVSALEELIFSQLLLTSRIYQHHKALSADALINDAVRRMSADGILKHPCDFLDYYDDDILGTVNELKTGCLPKRAFVINYGSVIEIDGKRTDYTAADIAGKLRKMALLRQEICNEAQRIIGCIEKENGGGKLIDLYDIHISIPKTSPLMVLPNALVLTQDNRLVKLSEIIRLPDMADEFSSHKWNAYVFSRSDIVPVVAAASKIVFEKNGLCFNEDILCIPHKR